MAKCPLLSISANVDLPLIECIKAECAWFTPVGCAVTELASGPRKLAGALNDINWTMQAHKIGQSVDIKHE